MINENQKVRKEFGRKLAGIRSWLNKRNYKVTSVSHSGLQAVPESGPLKRTDVYFLVIGPERVRKDLISKEAAKRLNNEVLRLSLVYNLPEVPEQAHAIFKLFPCPFKDKGGHSWWPTEPYKFSKSRVRLEFVTNLEKFLSNETEIEKEIKNSCEDIINNILTIIEKQI